MKLSIIIPAFNEAHELPQCLRTMDVALKTLDAKVFDQREVIVVDNNSADDTGEIARSHGATVVFEPVNQIARARNAGAAMATGDWLLFIDADSTLSYETLNKTVSLIAAERCGGGGSVISMKAAPLYGKAVVGIWNLISVICRIGAGSYLFCRADAFKDIGGFDEQYFAAEELYFCRALKRWCLDNKMIFRIIRGAPHDSSARKFEFYSAKELLGRIARGLFSFKKTVRSQDKLDFFYNRRS